MSKELDTEEFLKRVKALDLSGEQFDAMALFTQAYFWGYGVGVEKAVAEMQRLIGESK